MNKWQSITLDDVLIDVKSCLILYTLPHASVNLTDCISTVISLKMLTPLTTMLPFGFVKQCPETGL